jgi:circadian clock protein KaiC
MGLPGTGKTLLAEQIAFANGTSERPALYLSTLSEPLPRIITYCQRMTFCDVERIQRDVIYESLGETLAQGISKLVPEIRDLLIRYRPGVLLIDSFKAIADLAADIHEWRVAVFELAGLLSAYDVTSFWIGEYQWASAHTLVEFAVADAILELRRQAAGSRDDRFLTVAKLRGSDFLDGQHAFTISPAGLRVYPRLVGPAVPKAYTPTPERLRTGIRGLDDMIETGWLRGTSTLVVGPSGAGKTMLGLHFLRAGVEDGEAGLLVNFQETPAQLRREMHSLGWPANELLQPGKLGMLYTSPVELHIDTIVAELFERIERHNVQRVVIDALGDLEASARDPQRFTDYMYALTQRLAALNVTSMLTLEATLPHNPQLGVGRDVSPMTDNILRLDMEFDQDLTRTVRVVKARGSAHDGKQHALHISREGLIVD